MICSSVQHFISYRLQLKCAGSGGSGRNGSSERNNAKTQNPYLINELPHSSHKTSERENVQNVDFSLYIEHSVKSYLTVLICTQSDSSRPLSGRFIAPTKPVIISVSLPVSGLRATKKTSCGSLSRAYSFFSSSTYTLIWHLLCYLNIYV